MPIEQERQNEAKMLVMRCMSDMGNKLAPIHTLRGLMQNEPDVVDKAIEAFGNSLRQAVGELPSEVTFNKGE